VRLYLFIYYLLFTGAATWQYIKGLFGNAAAAAAAVVFLKILIFFIKI
jgi:hypothetical protein